jgi:hypothetical protein
VQFDSSTARKEAIAAAMPTSRAEVERAEVRLVRPDKTGKTTEVVQHYDTVYYDPYIAYYPSPLGIVAEAFLWSAMFSMAMTPHVVVVDHFNHVQGWADDPGIIDGPTIRESASDGDSWWGNDDATESLSDSTGDDGGSWWGGDSGGDGGSWWGGDGGGGDFGGGDFGGSFD